MNDQQTANQHHTSIFTTMSRLANEYKAINLGQGFPNFDGPKWMMEEAFKTMKEGKNQYAPSPGIYSLRKSIADYQNKYYSLDWNPEDEITVTAGATEALFSTIRAIINPGDEVILFEPYYDAYYADVVLAGGVPKYVTLKKPKQNLLVSFDNKSMTSHSERSDESSINEASGFFTPLRSVQNDAYKALSFQFDFDELESSISKSTKAIILNTPHNPTGKVFSNDELEFIASIAVKNNLIVISDEVYEFLTYDNNVHIPITSLGGMRDRTVTISSAGKTFSMTGWKIGYAIANKDLTDKIRNVHQWVTFAVNTPAQHAVAYAFGQLESYLPEFRKLYLNKRDYIYSELLNSHFKPCKPAGSYFMMVDLPKDLKSKKIPSLEKMESLSDLYWAEKLVKEYGIATIPPSVFYGKSDEGASMLRLCFAKTDRMLRDGVKCLQSI